MASFQAGAFRPDAAADGEAAAPVRSLGASLEGVEIRWTTEERFKEAKAAVDLTAAPRIVSVGRGIKSEENLALARDLAAAFDAELAASRPICDNGWLPMDRQIGSSGQTVAPSLYVAVGISGASVERFSAATPRMRARPALWNGSAVRSTSNMVSTWPPSRSVRESAAPLYGTC